LLMTFSMTLLKGGSGHGGEDILKNITFCQWSIPAEFPHYK
jgi:hypothetical protein